MTFTFNTAIPAAPNDPSVDQPDMLINNQSTNSILAVDHISFNTANGGQHKQVTFNNKNAAGAQTDPQSVLYTGSGTASSVSTVFYRNQNGILPISVLKAFGTFDNVGATLNAYNITASRTSAGQYTLTVPANILTGTSYSVLVQTGITALNPNRSALYSIISATQIDIAFRNTGNGVLADPDRFSVIILQI